ncbi:MAG: ABC transporter ATP-binding protein [Aggregatilineales bacterium]
MDVAVEFRGVSKSYGRAVIVHDLNLSVYANTFHVIFGAPACGKSTVLRLLTGLDKPDHGEIWMRGQNVTRATPGQRNIGYVPQSFALYPHYSVFDNIAYPLKLMGVSARDATPVVQRAAEQLKISHLLGKRPDQLSGGEKQRVAIARGIVKNTNIFVLDDPLTGLDFKLREQLFDDLRQMRAALGATFIYTTSDALETLMLAERISILDAGCVVEAGELETVYAQPQHVRTMKLLGFPEANLFSGTLDGGLCRTPLFDFRAALANGSAPAQVSVAVRPQDIVINPPAGSALKTFPADIVLVEDIGGEIVVYLEAAGLPLTAVVRHSDMGDPSEGRATAGIDPKRLFLYGPNGSSIGQGAH